MPDFLIPLITWGVIQFIKLIIDRFTSGSNLGWKALRSAWGFPSVHSGIAASITTLMYLQYGYDSPEFALAFCFSFLFRYDAANVRYEAGQHAIYLNQLSNKLQEIVSLTKEPHVLKERLGHTFIEVIGGIAIGVGLTLVYHIVISS